jgi:hypothetical protein
VADRQRRYDATLQPPPEVVEGEEEAEDDADNLARSTMRDHLPYLACPVCQEGARVLYRQSKMLFDYGMKVPETVLFVLIDTVCDPSKNGGKWISAIDIVPAGDFHDAAAAGSEFLSLENMKQPGECKRECLTIADVCVNQVMADREVDISEYLYDKFAIGEDTFVHTLCNKINKMCTDKAMQKLAPPPSTLLSDGSSVSSLGQEEWEPMAGTERRAPDPVVEEEAGAGAGAGAVEGGEENVDVEVAEGESVAVETDLNISGAGVRAKAAAADDAEAGAAAAAHEL